MPYNADTINKMLYKYIASANGQARLASLGINTGREQMLSIAKDLKNDIIAAYLRIVSDPQYAKMAFDAADSVKISVGVAGKSGDNKYIVRIQFTNKALARPSLFRDYAFTEQTGTGVYDIFGLLTHGVHYDYYRFGIWAHLDSGGEYTDDGSPGFIRSVKDRAANTFINDVINKYQAKYPYIEFRWPAEWGGNK